MGAVFDVTRALLLDFPWNRAVPGRVTVIHLLTPAQVYLVQIGLVFCGLLFSLYAVHRVSRDLLGGREAAFAAFLPMAGLAFLLTLLNLWSLAVGLL